MPYRRSIRLIFFCALVSVLGGCTTVRFVELREKPRNPITERLTRTAFGDPGPSVRTGHFLTATSYPGGNDYVHLLRHSRSQLDGPLGREALYATAELSYLAAEKAKTHDPGLAMELYLDAAHFSWDYTVMPDDSGRLNDPCAEPHRETTDLYNTSLEQLLRLARKGGDFRLGQPIRMPVSGRVVHTQIPFPTRWLSADQLGHFEFVSDYELKNLRNRHCVPGVGVPIMVRRQRPKSAPELERYYEDGLSLPVTVVARFPLNRHGAGEEHPEITLQLFDPRESDGILTGDTVLPLQADLSTPLAWFLTDPRKSLLDTFAFLRPDKAQSLEGLYMVTPYDPDRIPVLMVHGLWSSPMTWMEMFNDLQSDPVLRDNYQFWFYLYPTGEPLTFAAANLRDRLKELRQRCDPYGQNGNLDRMVVVGHSMGGLMSYLLTVESEDKLWSAMSQLPVDQIQADPETRHQIRRVFFFESDRSIDRIVTIASPFNGSSYANFVTRWVSGNLISLPNATSRLSQLIYRQNNQSIWDRMFTPRTSLDSLNKNSAVIRLVNQTTVPEEVHHHNIVGVKSGHSLDDWTDGVVKTRSASRPDADSEIRVRAGHSAVHRHPETIAEVRRVLLEHLEDVRRRSYPVVPLGHARETSWSPQNRQLAP
ncbi:MAG: alpha/beta hydrolase [Fuerstiella sp.]